MPNTFKDATKDVTENFLYLYFVGLEYGNFIGYFFFCFYSYFYFYSYYFFLLLLLVFLILLFLGWLAQVQKPHMPHSQR